MACVRRPQPTSHTPARSVWQAPPSGAGDLVRSLSDEVGPRLAGSPGDARAVEWGLRTMRNLGFANVHPEPVRVPHWERGVGRGEITAPFAHDVVLTALGGSVATAPDGIEAEVIEVDSLDALDALPEESARGKIVFVHHVMPRFRDGGGYGRAVTIRSRGASRAARKGAVALIIRSAGTDHARVAHTGALRYEDGVTRIPAAALSVPDAEMLHRIVQGGHGSVRFRLVLGCRELPEADSANVVGEIPGSDRAREVILLAAHLDSWDLGTGAIDDGAGCAIVLEAARRVAREHPRRTVRAVLFANEENGLAGARAYAQAHANELAAHVVAIEADEGDGRVYALRYAGSDAGRALFDDLAASVESMGVTRLRDEAHGGADLSPLAPAGVPRLDLLQDMGTYFDHHHTVNDTPAILNERALDQAVAVFAAVVARVAAMDGDFGRAPVGRDSH